MYTFYKVGEGLAFGMDKFLDEKFLNPINPKDGFALSDYENIQACRVLEFLMPILYREKPTWIIIIIATTIFGVVSRKCKVDRSIVIWDLILKLVSKIRKSKSTSICSYIFYLYHSLDKLRGEEMVTYKATEAMFKYDIKLDLEPQS